MDYFLLQARLAAAGTDPGPVDGVPGRRTASALIAYQRGAGLQPTGQADPATLAALFPQLSAAARIIEPPWHALMRGALGLEERRDGTRIVAWATTFGGFVGRYFKDAHMQPWCALAVGHFIGAALPLEPLPANPLSALAYVTLGRALAEPALGAIIVFRRPGGGHVGLYAGEDREAFHILGGNQGDRISIARIAKARAVAVRWPALAAIAPGPRILRGPDSALSANEA